MQAAPPAWSSAKLHAAHRQWLPQRRVPRLIGRHGFGFTAGRAGHRRRRRQPHLVRYVAGHCESQPLTRLRRNVNGVGEFDFLLLEFGDLGPQLRLGGLQLLHPRCAARNTFGRVGDRQCQYTHTTAARIAARRVTDPKRCSDCCSAADNHGLRDRVTVVPARDAPAPVPRGRPCFESPVFPDLPVLGVGGPPLRIRPLRELRARAIWPCPLLFAQAARRPRQIGGKPGRRHIGRHHRVFPRSAAAGCTSRRARCGPARRS